MDMPASIDGQPIFGLALHMTTAENPRDCQRNGFPGLNGVEELDMGQRGRFTMASGIIYGDSPPDLASWIETLRSFNDGLTHVLVDTNGTTWLNVKVESFEPEPHGHLWPPLGYARRYQIRFRHLQ